MNNAKHFVINSSTQLMTDGMLSTGRCWGDLETCEFWDKADFILLTPWRDSVIGPGAYRAVNVKITGRTVRYDVKGMLGCGVVRVLITMPGDCEPDETVGGWVLANTLGENLDILIEENALADSLRRLR